MLNLTGPLRIFIYSLPSDMRCQIDGLKAIVSHTLQYDVFTGDYFVFFNRTRTMCKILRWESTGFELFVKRLERGTFRRPEFHGDVLATAVDGLTLAMILGGVDLTATQQRKRYRREVTAAVRQRDAVQNESATARELHSSSC